MRWKNVSNRGGDPAGSNPSTRKHSSDQYLMSPVAGLHAQLPVCVSPCASAKYDSLRRSSSSARLRSVESSTNATPSARLPSANAAPPTPDTQLPPLRNHYSTYASHHHA